MITAADALKLRHELGETQTIFWGRFGVRQATGSRYEIGIRQMDAPIRRLIYLMHYTSIESYLTDSEIHELASIL